MIEDFQEENEYVTESGSGRNEEGDEYDDNEEGLSE